MVISGRVIVHAPVQRHLCPHQRVETVKCPLNAVSAHSLRKMLHVQGISDWSIERILEQTIR